MSWKPLEGMEEYLSATELCDCDNIEVKNRARELTKDAATPKEAAMNIFNFVRDQILFGFNRYDAKASETLKGEIGFCITKSTLQVALLRAAGIPARYHQVVLSNESLKGLVPDSIYKKKVPKKIGYHSCCECYLAGRWVVCEALFDKALYTAACKKGIMSEEKIPNIDWDGDKDLLVVAPFMLEDKGIFHSLDGQFKKLQDENKLPGIMARIVFRYMNRHINKLRKG
jgi:hypothetical protein